MSSVFNLPPYTREHLWCGCFNSCADSVLQTLQISYYSSTYNVLDVPQEEKIHSTFSSKLQVFQMAFSYKPSTFLWNVLTSGGCSLHVAVSFQIHSTYADHSLTILFPWTKRHIARSLCTSTLSTVCNSGNTSQTHTKTVSLSRH